MQMIMQDSAQYQILRVIMNWEQSLEKGHLIYFFLFLVTGKLPVTPPSSNPYVFDNKYYQKVNMNGQ